MSWTTIPQLLEEVRDPEDETAWNRFVEKYRPLLAGYVRAKGLADADVEDIVQNILIRLLRVMPKFELDHQKGKFRTWLYKVTMFTLRDHYRSAVSRNRVEEEHKKNVAEWKEDDGPDAEWQQTYQERILEVALEQVKTQTMAKSWQCFEQFVLKGRPGNDIAREVGLTPNAVRVNANRILEKVRVLCAEYLAEEDHDNLHLPGS